MPGSHARKLSLFESYAYQLLTFCTPYTDKYLVHNFIALILKLEVVCKFFCLIICKMLIIKGPMSFLCEAILKCPIIGTLHHL